MARIADWWAANAAEGKTSILGAYSFGKAQRLLAGLPDLGPILTHGAVEEMTQVLRDQGYDLPKTIRVTPETTGKTHPGALAIAPPSALGSGWSARLGPVDEAFVSGWMAVRGIRRRRALGTGFVLSDHADWQGLNDAIRETGAEQVFVTHGYTAPFRQWLESQGYDAGIVETRFGDEAEAEARVAE
jgi:putative mRNA 3-end processing factor